jgi:hypothetical protein
MQPNELWPRECGPRTDGKEVEAFDEPVLRACGHRENFVFGGGDVETLGRLVAGFRKKPCTGCAARVKSLPPGAHMTLRCLADGSWEGDLHDGIMFTAAGADPFAVAAQLAYAAAQAKKRVARKERNRAQAE